MSYEKFAFCAPRILPFVQSVPFLKFVIMAVFLAEYRYICVIMLPSDFDNLKKNWNFVITFLL